MDIRSSAVRALRTFLQGAAATLIAFYTSIKGDGTLVNIKAHGSVLAFGFFLAGTAAVVSFVQNLIETRAASRIPRG